MNGVSDTEDNPIQTYSSEIEDYSQRFITKPIVKTFISRMEGLDAHHIFVRPQQKLGNPSELTETTKNSFAVS